MIEYKQEWITCIIESAIHFKNHTWEAKHNSTEYEFVYDGQCYPPKRIFSNAHDLMHDKFPHLKLTNLAGGEDTNYFLRELGFEVIEKKFFTTASLSFIALLGRVREALINRGYEDKLVLDKSVQTHYYAWFGDDSGLIGNQLAHYELIRRRANSKNIYIEAHFEDEMYHGFLKPLFVQDFGHEVKQIKHGSTDGLRLDEVFDLDLPDAADHIAEGLIRFNELVGEHIREIVQRRPIYVKVFPDEDDSVPLPIDHNQILFGPPGTGKTYHTINEALRIVDPKFYKLVIHGSQTPQEKRKELTKRFKELIIKDWKQPGKGQIVFTTFHQSLAYEDFIEGIKPQKDDDNQVYYEIEDGIFKRLCLLAGEKISSSNFEEAYAKFAEEVIEKGTIEFTTFEQKKKFDVEINKNMTAVAIPKTNKRTRMSVTKDMIRAHILTGEIKDWKPYITAIGSYIKEHYKVNVQESNNQKKNYVIIIDEINRGNVSSIFGELITLIEPSKRRGRAEELEIILPYSKKGFSVPDNVFLIGTMNTADRSVEALDTALRRRFSFTEMIPDPTILAGIVVNGVQLDIMLDTINVRLAKLIDKDHQIGHAYFIGINTHEQLLSCFQNKILPLLCEYFYGEIGKIGLVLGSSFIEKELNTVKFAAFNDYDSSEANDLASRVIYKITSAAQWNFSDI
jgi:5-methylcytosine-specific restriction protein B